MCRRTRVPDQARRDRRPRVALQVTIRHAPPRLPTATATARSTARYLRGHHCAPLAHRARFTKHWAGPVDERASFPPIVATSRVWGGLPPRFAVGIHAEPTAKTLGSRRGVRGQKGRGAQDGERRECWQRWMAKIRMRTFVHSWDACASFQDYIIRLDVNSPLSRMSADEGPETLSARL